jgi:hypothetical protein
MSIPTPKGLIWMGIRIYRVPRGDGYMRAHLVTLMLRLRLQYQLQESKVLSMKHPLRPHLVSPTRLRDIRLKRPRQRKEISPCKRSVHGMEPLHLNSSANSSGESEIKFRIIGIPPTPRSSPQEDANGINRCFLGCDKLSIVGFPHGG